MKSKHLRRRPSKGPAEIDSSAAARLHSQARSQLIDEAILEQLNATKKIAEGRRGALNVFFGASAAAAVLIFISWLKH